MQILEKVDDVLDGEDINLLKCSDEDVDETYGIGYLPRLVYFQRGIPHPYEGDERNPDEIVRWVKQEVDTDELIIVNKAILVRSSMVLVSPVEQR